MTAHVYEVAADVAMYGVRAGSNERGPMLAVVVSSCGVASVGSVIVGALGRYLVWYEPPAWLVRLMMAVLPRLPVPA